MAASHCRAIGICFSARFWFSAILAALMPTTLGYRDAVAMVTPAAGISQRWGVHLMASPFGTIEPATFSYARPIGTAMPRPPRYLLASYDSDSDDATIWSVDGSPNLPPATEIVYPTVNRRLKGDRQNVIEDRACASAPGKFAATSPHCAWAGIAIRTAVRAGGKSHCGICRN